MFQLAIAGDMYIIIGPGVDGAQLIWSMWLEEEHEEGNGLAAHGEIGNGRVEVTLSPLLSGQRGNSAEYTIQRLIRDAHDEQIEPERRSAIQSLIEDVKNGAQAHPEVII